MPKLSPSLQEFADDNYKAPVKEQWLPPVALITMYYHEMVTGIGAWNVKETGYNGYMILALARELAQGEGK